VPLRNQAWPILPLRGLLGLPPSWGESLAGAGLSLVLVPLRNQAWAWPI
jgi:hypothetical protein